jgi:hypothetical protein
MKLKKSMYERKCTECKTIIKKGNKYGQKSILLGSKKDGQKETYDGLTITVHQLRVPMDFCNQCCIKQGWVKEEVN